MLIKLEARNPRVELGKALAVCEALGIEFAIPDTDAPSKTSDSESDWDPFAYLDKEYGA